MAEIFPCKLIAQVAFKAGGDEHHNLFANKPLHLATAVPGKVQDCVLHEGEYGTIGSIIEWKYNHDGKPQVAKQMVQAIDTEKKHIAFKMLEGDLLDVYKAMLISTHIETKGGVEFVTWTLDYELREPNNPHPVSLLNYFVGLTSDIEAHIFG